MNAKTLLAGTTIALALAAAAATPANAVVTKFATFSTLPATTYDFYYKNPGSTHPTVAGASANATFYTVSSNTSKVPGSVLVQFSFDNEGGYLDGAVSNVTAKYTLTGATDGPAVVDSFSGNLEQHVDATFSFVTTAPITVDHTLYPTGSILLSGTYGGAILTGDGTSGGISANNTKLGRTLTLSSDFVTFTTGNALDASFTLNAANPAFSDLLAGMYSFKTFKADDGGSFSADPVPKVNAVPEPASWALMMVGFGLAGASIRRRSRVQAAA